MPMHVYQALTTWQFEPFAALPLAALAAYYLTAALDGGRWRDRRREAAPPGDEQDPGRRGRTAARWRRRGRARALEGEWHRPVRPWPAWRTAAFCAGLAVIAIATMGWPGVYDETVLGAHMVQHLLLIMVAPPLLIAGRPVTLLLHTVRNPWHTRVKRALRSRLVSALTWPPAAVALYCAVVLGTHLTSLLTARGALHDAEHVAYLVAGYLFFLPVIGSEPIRWRPSVFSRFTLLLAAMPADIVTGAVLMVHGPIGPYGAANVRAGGLVMLAGGELIMTALAMGLAVAMVRERTIAPSGAEDLVAYNAYLASLERPEV